jgi:hypothetical protein
VYVLLIRKLSYFSAGVGSCSDICVASFLCVLFSVLHVCSKLCSLKAHETHPDHKKKSVNVIADSMEDETFNSEWDVSLTCF